ncbi:type II toxin-antitoxin system HipA family toxin [Reichenbachiella ulvae]|uniref:Type II toxin-antitoxin system HipA family toxin n=1 Tax=Reichenbachiella ulvae TaxID=2980104 RepID=A0ABT3CNG7_9BACT|nr:type II toxin-antitoxin system HipA family toxin [Reichenbachiella ulvae]MCV9385286.1 type II toxin-antitoxin system HipA family toxin [Reichenbachiella ulvae]
MIKTAEVWIWETFVGAIHWDEKRQLARFQYDSKFQEKGWDLSPFKMPISQGIRTYEFPELRKGENSQDDTYRGLPGLFADCLPDRFGTQLMDIWQERNGKMNSIEQLCFIGNRGMGALEYRPADDKNDDSNAILEIDRLVEVGHMALHRMSLNAREEEFLEQWIRIGTSAGGARPKAVIAYNERTGEIKTGHGAMDPSFEPWLIKFDGVSGAQFGESLGWGQVEYAYYLMAKECGIDMMECQTIHDGKRVHFMTKRFDRGINNEKHHTQTLCAMQHYDYNRLQAFSYEQLFETITDLGLTDQEKEQMFRRMVFNVIATNYDDHTKNFAFRLKKGGRWELTPAYDVCYAYDPTNNWVNQQTLSVNGKHSGISKADLMTIAYTNNINRGEEIIDQIIRVVKGWSDFATKVEVDEKKKKEIRRNLNLL